MLVDKGEQYLDEDLVEGSRDEKEEIDSRDIREN